MNQTTFIDPSSTVPAADGGNTGNGTMSTPVPSSATLTEDFTITCTVPGGANVGEFSVTGSVSGLLGTATSDEEFVDADQKVRFTLTAGGTPWAVSDEFTFSTVAGTVLNEANFDDHADPIAAKDEANLFSESQRVEKAAAPGWELRRTGIAVDAGGLWRLVIDGSGNILLQCNTAAAGDFSTAAAFTVSPAAKVLAGTIPLARMAHMTTLTFTSIAAGAQSTQDVTHGLGTDNVAIILMLDDNANASVIAASQRPDGFGAVVSNGGTTFPNVALPATGKVQVGVINNLGSTQTIRVRVIIMRED